MVAQRPLERQPGMQSPPSGHHATDAGGRVASVQHAPIRGVSRRVLSAAPPDFFSSPKEIKQQNRRFLNVFYEHTSNFHGLKPTRHHLALF